MYELSKSQCESIVPTPATQSQGLFTCPHAYREGVLLDILNCFSNFYLGQVWFLIIKNKAITFLLKACCVQSEAAWHPMSMTGYG